MVMPLYDDNPFTQPIKPVVTWCLIALNLGIFFYETGATQLALERMIDTFSLTPAAFSGDMPARGNSSSARFGESIPGGERRGSAIVASRSRNQGRSVGAALRLFCERFLS